MEKKSVKCNRKKAVFRIFLAALILPTVSYPVMRNFIDTENHENRSYAEFPSLSNFNFLTFSEEFETAFTDHLPYKNQLTQLREVENSILQVGTTLFEYEIASYVIRGDGWLFYNANADGEYTLKDYRGVNLYEESELATIAGNYTAFSDFLMENYDCQVIFVYVPNKEQIYSEYMPSRLVHTDYTRTAQLTDYLNQNTEVPVNYLLEELLFEKEQGNQVYRKYDSHWNRLGAFVGSQAIRGMLTGESLSLEDVTYEIDEWNVSGDLADLLAMTNVYNDDVNYAVDYVNGGKTLSDSLEDSYFVFENTGENVADLTVLMTGDSFSSTLSDAMAGDYSTFIYVPNTEYIPEMMRRYRPDILVLETSERSTTRQEDWPETFIALLSEE